LTDEPVVCRPDESHPGALMALRQGLSLQRVLKDAKSMKHESIVTFHNLRYDVYSQLANFDQTSGIQVDRLIVLCPRMTN